MGVALRRAFVFGRRDGRRVAAWRILRRIEWQVRHSDRFEDTTTYARGNKYLASHHRITRSRYGFQIDAPEVRRSLRRQVAEVERHQIELAFTGNARETARPPSRLRRFVMSRQAHTKLIEQRHICHVGEAGNAGGHSRSLVEGVGIKTGGDVLGVILHVMLGVDPGQARPPRRRRAHDDDVRGAERADAGREGGPVGHGCAAALGDDDECPAAAGRCSHRE